MSPHVLVPYDKREGMTLREAAKLAGKSEGTVRTWCQQYDIGRRVAGGPWCVSRVALAAYHAGDRHGPLVASYFERLGLGALLKAWRPSQDLMTRGRPALPNLR